MSESQLGPALFALGFAFVALYAGLTIHPGGEYLMSPTEFDIDKNANEETVTIDVVDINKSFKSLNIQTVNGSQTVVTAKSVTVNVPKGTTLKITAKRKGQSSVYADNKVLFEETVEYDGEDIDTKSDKNNETSESPY